jgi:hypothetical protein
MFVKRQFWEFAEAVRVGRGLGRVAQTLADENQVWGAPLLAAFSGASHLYVPCKGGNDEVGDHSGKSGRRPH